METNEEVLEEAGTKKEDSSMLVHKALAKQCAAEYLMAWKHQSGKKEEAEIRLKLYNNQTREKGDVGDTTLFSTMQTVLAALYIDRLSVEFGGKEEGDEETADNLTAMADSDYTDMEKDIIDFDWDWDTLFFGRGLVDLSEWERDADKGIFLPIPNVVDPIPFLRHPNAVSINGNRSGKGAARFFGSEVKMTAQEIEELPHLVKTFKMSSVKFGSGSYSILKDAIEARDLAQGRQAQNLDHEQKSLGVNAEYDITIWHTHRKVGKNVKKVKVWLANNRTEVIAEQILKHDFWSIIDRPLYPTAHDWDGTSIPDLVEDKQRARATAQNLGLKAMTADLYPNYIFDTNKVTNSKDLKFGFNKYIPVDAKNQALSNAIMPLIKARPNMELFNYILTTLDLSAQKATATSDIQQGIQPEKDRTLGENNLIASRTDTRYSLSAKIFGWSEKRFWQQWYRMYKDNFAEKIDEKVLRVVGALGAKHRPLSRDDIIADKDPHVMIESKVLSRAKQLEERVSLTEYFALALQEPTSNRRWGLKKLGKVTGLENDELDMLFPPTIDERIAEAENEFLSENKNDKVEVQKEDDHNVHLEVHNKATDTDAKYAHMKSHEEALSVKKVNPEFFPEDNQATDFQAPGAGNVLPINDVGNEEGAVAPSQTSGQA